MVKVTLITTEPKIIDIVPETTTIREFLEKHDVNYGMATTSVDGIPLQVGGMDMDFNEHGVDKRCIVTCLPNKDNAASATILGSTCVVKSSLTPEEILRVKKLHEEALVLFDDDGDPAFAIDYDEESPGEIDENGICFGGVPGPDGKAFVTILLDPTIENKVEAIYEMYGRSMMYLEDLEKHIADVLPQMNEEENKIKAMITEI